MLLLLIVLQTYLLANIKVSDFINKKQCDFVYRNKIIKSCFNYKFKGTTAVYYTIKSDYINKINLRKRAPWKLPNGIDKKYLPKLNDYYKNEYKFNIGHLANDASYDYSKEALSLIYILGVNAIPQDNNVNKYKWFKAEIFSRFLADYYGKVRILDLVHYSDKKFGTSNMYIPDYFIKVLMTRSVGNICLKYSNNYKDYPPRDKLSNHIIKCEDIYQILKY